MRMTHTMTSVILMVAFCCSCTMAQSKPEVIKKGSGTKVLEKVTKPYQVKFEMSNGDVVIEVHPEWAPVGATHFKNLVEAKFYDDARFFRVLDNFMAQVGMNADPKVHAKFSAVRIKDEDKNRKKQLNKRGTITFGKGRAPHTRSTHIFFNYVDNEHLDGKGFPPFAKVIKGMDVVDSLYSGYGTKSTDQAAIAEKGNAYLKQHFPKLDYIKTARILKPEDELKKKEVIK